jgi:chloramphenicol 3-O-phosphotransferase
MTSEKTLPLRIALVGPCASGKSTLAKMLADGMFEIRHVAQDHSFVPDMWRRVSKPDVLIYLDVDYETIKARRPITTLRPADLAEQERRLAHARKHCDLLIDTSSLTPAEVAAQAMEFLNSLRS